MTSPNDVVLTASQAIADIQAAFDQAGQLIPYEVYGGIHVADWGRIVCEPEMGVRRGRHPVVRINIAPVQRVTFEYGCFQRIVDDKYTLEVLNQLAKPVGEGLRFRFVYECPSERSSGWLETTVGIVGDSNTRYVYTVKDNREKIRSWDDKPEGEHA